MSKKTSYYVYFKQLDAKTLQGDISRKYIPNCYSLVGCHTMKEALIQFKKDIQLFKQNWKVI